MIRLSTVRGCQIILKVPQNVESDTNRPSRKAQDRPLATHSMMDREILDVEGAATLLDVSTTTIYNLAREGDIPPHGWAESGTLLVRILFNGWPMALPPINSAWR